MIPLLRPKRLSMIDGCVKGILRLPGFSGALPYPLKAIFERQPHITIVGCALRTCRIVQLNKGKLRTAFRKQEKGEMRSS